MSEIRVDRFKAEDGISAPQFPNGLQVTGVVTATVLDTSVPFLNAGSNVKLGAAGVVTATSFSGNVIGGTISGTTGTFSGSVSVGGTLTYEDVTNIDSVGIVTARLGLRVPDNVYSYFGTGNDLSIRHDQAGGNHSYIFNHGAGVLKIGSDTQFIIGKTSNATYIQANPDGDVKLYHNNNQKIATNSAGATVTGTVSADAADIDDFVSVGSNIHLGNAGIITATSFVGSGANLTGIVAIPTGAIMAWPVESAPTGFILCHGQAISRSTYSALFSLIGSMYGNGDGSSNFNLPDYRGQFLRGRANGSANDPDRSSRTDRGDGNGGDNVGTKQDYGLLQHSHGNNSNGTNNHGFNTNNNNTGAFSKSGHSYGGSRASSHEIITNSWGTNHANVDGHVTNNEIRPINIYVNWIIKT